MKQEKNNEKQNFINIFSNGITVDGRRGDISKAELILEALQKFNIDMAELKYSTNKKANAGSVCFFFYDCSDSQSFAFSALILTMSSFVCLLFAPPLT